MTDIAVNDARVTQRYDVFQANVALYKNKE